MWFPLLFSSLLVVCVSGQACAVTTDGKSFKGVCKTVALCQKDGQESKAGACPGAVDYQCCLNDYGSCGSGKCIPESACLGTTQAGLCPGPAAIKCCTPKTTGPGTPPPTPRTGTRPGVQPGNTKQWLKVAGKYEVENLSRVGRRSSSALGTVTKFCLHTIEGLWPTNGDWELGTRVLDGSKYWPHFIVAKDKSGRVRIGQYLPMDIGGYALAANNRPGVVQVEIGAKAERPFTKHDLVITDAVRELYYALLSVHPNLAATVDSRVTFKDSSAYGNSGSARLSTAAWASVSGLVGHQHVPSNTHWDPGAIDPNHLIKTPPTFAAYESEGGEGSNGIDGLLGEDYDKLAASEAGVEAGHGLAEGAPDPDDTLVTNGASSPMLPGAGLALLLVCRLRLWW